MFSATGRVKGETRTIHWDDGELSGDMLAVHAVEAIALTRQPVGPVGGPYTRDNHLQSALSARMLIEKAFDSIDKMEGDVPQVPDVPDGAHP